MTTPLVNLDYAPLPRLHERRVVRRAAAVVLIAAGLMFGLRFGPTAWRAAKAQYWQRACLRYEPPAGQVVCEELPAWAGNVPPFLSAIPKPRQLSELEAALGVAAAAARGPVLYLHERRTADGRRYLVVVRRVPPDRRQSWDAPVGLDVEIRDPPGWFARGSQAVTTFHPDPFPRAFEAQQDAAALTIFAGRSDAEDQAGFTIAFETADGRGTLAGTLRDPASPGRAAVVEWHVR